MSKRSPKGRQAGRVVRKRLADGTYREYHYGAWRPQEPTPREAPGTLGALLSAYRRSPAWKALAATTQETYTVYLRELEALAAAPAIELRKRDLITLRDAIASSRGPGAATGFVRAAKAMLGWATESDHLEVNPAAGLRPLKGGHLTAWTEDDYTRALEVLAEPYRRIVILAAHTGQRRGDLCRMPWSAYDGRRIRLVQQKTGQPVRVPVHKDLQAELARWREDTPGLLILTPPRADSWQPEHMSREMKRVLTAAGLPGLNVHGLRKLAANRMAEAGCTPHELSAVLGWQTLAMAALYTADANRDRLAEAAIVRLEAHRKRS